MKTKGISLDERLNLISLLMNKDSAEIASLYVGNQEHLTKEQHNELLCVAAVRHILESRHTVKGVELLKQYLMQGVCPRTAEKDSWSAWHYPAKLKDVHGRLESRDNISIARSEYDRLLKLGYQGSRVKIRGKIKFMQFYCGKSKPSFEIKI